MFIAWSYPLHKRILFWKKRLTFINWIRFYILFCSYIWEFFMGAVSSFMFMCILELYILLILISAFFFLIFRVRPVRIHFLLNGIIQRRKFMERKWRWVFIYIPRSCHFYLYLIVHQHQQDFDLNLFYNNCRIGSDLVLHSGIHSAEQVLIHLAHLLSIGHGRMVPTH